MDKWRKLPTGVVVTTPAGAVPPESSILNDGRQVFPLNDEEFEPETDETGRPYKAQAGQSPVAGL